MKKSVIDYYIHHHSSSIFDSIVSGLENVGYLCEYGCPSKVKKKYSGRDFKQYNNKPHIDRMKPKTMDLIVGFGQKIRTLYKSQRCPILTTMKGAFFPLTWFCDFGLWKDSVIYNRISGLLDEINDDGIIWATDYSRSMSSQNISKRTQTGNLNIKGDFVFLPIQRMDDESIKRYFNESYPYFIKEVAKFCSRNSLKLIIKMHPEINRKVKKGNWRDIQQREIRKILKSVRKICPTEVVDGSVHWLCKNCVFMANVNAGTAVDAMMNSCVVSHCGESIFSNSGAVVHDLDIQKGLNKCLNMSNADKKILYRRQRACLYFLYNRYLLLSRDEHLSSWSNRDKVINIMKWAGYAA